MLDRVLNTSLYLFLLTKFFSDHLWFCYFSENSEMRNRRQTGSTQTKELVKKIKKKMKDSEKGHPYRKIAKYAGIAAAVLSGIYVVYKMISWNTLHALSLKPNERLSEKSCQLSDKKKITKWSKLNLLAKIVKQLLQEAVNINSRRSFVLVIEY